MLLLHDLSGLNSFFLNSSPHISAHPRSLTTEVGRGIDMEKFNKECTISFIKICLSVVSSLVKTLQLLV